MSNSKMTYISLFSSAGIGCYGFKLEGFDCIATNELISRRLEIQKFNNKCKYDSGYICGDITLDSTKENLFTEIYRWKKQESVSRVDVLIATPPCQGMSVANHKKTSTEIIRNSLVIESIKVIKEVYPKFFIFENVAAFMKTICTDIDGKDKTISEAIENNLGSLYSYASKVINFKDYGACSSRQRTLVIGVSNDLADEVSPLELYPSLVPEKTLRETIGNMKRLTQFGEIEKSDIYHSFRTYPEHMRVWISELEEGQSAFDNEEESKKPHQIIDGKLVINTQKNGDKYKRQYWDKVGPCIHTRNDQLASQNTVHPSDDRVFSIRELMAMMTVPNSFKWVETNFDELNEMSYTQKKAFLKKEEVKIRQSLGEAVPTMVFNAIAKKIRNSLNFCRVKTSDINKIVAQQDFSDVGNLIEFIKTNPLNLSLSALSKIAELSNTSRTDNAGFFTNKALITEMIKNLPDTDKDEIRILEPSVGVGNFIPLLLKKFEGKRLTLDLVDIDEKSIKILQAFLEKYGLPESCQVNYIVDDFLLHQFDGRYDYIIGNPPFYKMNPKDSLLSLYRNHAVNKETTNICSFFLDKAITLGNYVALVFPKFILNTPEFKSSRAYLSKMAIDCIIDFGEKGFPGVLVETIALFVNNNANPQKTRVISITKGIEVVQKQNYISDEKLPYWVIYRNELFDDVCSKLDLDVFKVFRDRQITNKNLSSSGEIRVLKSRNINDTGTEVIDIESYDSYTNIMDVQGMSVFNYFANDDVYLTPNMTYKPRVIKKPKNLLVNGSLAILIPKDGVTATEEQLLYFSSDEYRNFYQIARNYQTRSLNVDACSVYFYGLLRKERKVVPILERAHYDDNFQLSLFRKSLKECNTDVNSAINY